MDYLQIKAVMEECPQVEETFVKTSGDLDCVFLHKLQLI